MTHIVARKPSVRATQDLVALDIETTGLDPDRHEVIAVGIRGPSWSATLTDRDEPRLLALTETIVNTLDRDSVLATWNGEEFDLPFLKRRFEHHSIGTELKLTRTEATGKYGDPLYRGSWGHRTHIDIAPLYRDIAQALEVPWNLKPVARAELGISPIEVERAGSAIERLDDATLGAYVASDADITWRLASRVLEASTTDEVAPRSSRQPRSASGSTPTK